MRKYANLALFLGILLVLAMPTRATVYAKIKGRVVDAQTGKGVEGVLYRLYFVNIDRSTLPPSCSLWGKGFLEENALCRHLFNLKWLIENTRGENEKIPQGGKG